MMATLNLWFFPIAASAVHGLFLAIVLWLKKRNQQANRLFALLLLSLSLHLLDYSLNISGLILAVPHLMFSSYPLLFVMAPLFYLYVRSYLGLAVRQGWRTVLHFALAVLVFLSMLPFYLLPAATKITFLETVAEDAFQTIPTEQFIIMFLQIGQFLFYAALAYRLIQQQEKTVIQFRSNGNVPKIKWLKRSTIAFGVFTLFYGLMTSILVLQNQYRVETDYVVVLLLALLIFVIGYVALSQPHLFAEGLKRGRNHKQLTPSSALSLQVRLEQLMIEEKPFLREELKINDVAQLLDIPAHHLSELLNNGLHTNFADFINNYRIETAKKLLLDPKRQTDKIITIAFDSGFNNKGTFNRVFKQLTGQTPSGWRGVNGEKK